MHWIDTVASYLPSLIVNHLINRTTNEELPSRQEYDTVCLFADVSGFTALSEAMMTSTEGVEGLAKHLNSYFGQMVRIIASEGGDVFKFAGDALIVLWPPPTRDSLTDAVSNKRGREGDTGELEGTTPMERRVRRAAQCAFAIQEALHYCELAQEVRLSVKIGIGMGKVSVLHLGGVYKRMEYIAVGEPLLEAFTAEHHATPGDVIISAQAHKLVKGHCTTMEVFTDSYCRVIKEPRYTPMRKQNKVNMLQQTLDDPLLEVKVKGYIPGAVLRNLRPDSPEDEHWSNEIRRVTVLFVNLGLKEQTLLAAAVYDEAMKEMHRVMVAVQNSVYEYEGSINKFLMDDKGSTLVAVYGLPPVGHADDPTRGVLAALRLCERLFDLAKVGSVGITTGEAFCGVVGSKTRKEYTVLGDSVNLAARLMQRATSEDGGVLCELATKRACRGLLQFKARGDFRIKGKTAAAKVFQPYPEDFPKPQPPQYLGANVYGLIHNQQRQNYAIHKLLTSLQAYFARPSLKETKESFSGPTSGVSSPVSDHRGRSALAGTGRGSSYVNARASATEILVDDYGGDVEPGSNLLGKGDSSIDDSDEENLLCDVCDEDVLNQHAELQQPSYSADVIRRPFNTGPLPLGYPAGAEACYHPSGRDASAGSATDPGGGTVGEKHGGSVPPVMLAESIAPASSDTVPEQRRSYRKRSFNQSSGGVDDRLEGNYSAGDNGGGGKFLQPFRRAVDDGAGDSGVGTGGGGVGTGDDAPDPQEYVGRPLNSRNLSKAEEQWKRQQQQQQQQDEIGLVDVTGAERVPSTAAGSTVAAGRNGVSAFTFKSSTSITAKVFDRSASTAGGAQSSIAPSGASSVGGGGSPGTMSPNSATTESAPQRGLPSRRQGDSHHLQKLFRNHVPDNGEDCVSPRSRSPSDGNVSPCEGEAEAVRPARDNTKDGVSPWATRSSAPVPSSSAAATALDSAPATLTVPPVHGADTKSQLHRDDSGGSAGSEGNSTRERNDGGVSRVAVPTSTKPAASVMPRSVSDPSEDTSSGSGSGSGHGAKLAQPLGPGRAPSTRSSKILVDSIETDANDGGPLGEPREKQPMHKMLSFKHPAPSNVAVNTDDVYPVRVHRKRSSRRLSIAQNGMVPLPASAGIPQWDSVSSASCSLPRYSRFSEQQFGNSSSSSMFPAVNPAFQGNNSRYNSISNSGANHHHHSHNHNHQPATQSAAPAGNGQVLSGPAAPIVTPGQGVLSSAFTAAFGAPGSRSGPTRRMDDSTSSTASSNGGAMRTMVHPSVNVEGIEDTRLQVVVPRSWEWSSLPSFCHRLPDIYSSEVPTFKALLDRCWTHACGDAEVSRWSKGQPPAPEDLVLNILGTRVMLPTDPDYDITWLPAFVKEACGTRGFRGFMDRKRSVQADYGGGGYGSVELCLVPRREILNVQSRWLNSRIRLLQHKIALVTTQVGSIVLLEGLPGAGKTEVLSVFAARTMPRTALIHFTAASPYNANKRFGGWSMVLQQYLDSLLKLEIQAGRDELSNGATSSGHSSVRPSMNGGADRMANGAKILGHRPLGGRDRMLLRELRDCPEMEAYAFLVNDVLGTDLPSKGYVPAWDGHSSSMSSSGDGSESDASDSDEGCSVGHQEKLRLRILLHLVRSMANSKPRVVVIDDAQFLDEDSWTLALAVATGGPMGQPLPIMLVLSLRPLAHYRGLFASIPPDYKALTELEQVRFLKIEGAPPEEVEDLVSEKLGTNVVDIGDSLFGLVEELCTGNPLMISELVSHLKMVEPRQLRYSEIRSEEGEQGGSQNNIDVAVHVSLTESFRIDGSLLPDKINALLTAQTDRLNSCQLMALKVASLIGKEFSTWFLYRVYPINGHKDRLLRELAGLEEQGFLVEVQGARSQAVMDQEGSGGQTSVRDVSVAGSVRSLSNSSYSHSRSNSIDSSARGGSRNNNIVYKFTHGFMMGMLQLKMLKSQKSFLKDRIQKLKDSLETQKRHEGFKHLIVDNSHKKSGTLSVMKYKVTMSQAATNARETTRRRKDSITSRAMRKVKQPMRQKWGEAVDWKRRKCLLTGESLSLFTDPKDIEPSQIVYLKGATADAELGEVFKDSAFRLETSKWKKGDELVDGERRTFTFLAESKDEKELWLYQIRHCIEVIEVHERKSGKGNIDRFTHVNSTRFGAVDARPSEVTEEVDSTLVVRVEEADDLILQEIFGTTYPYCLVDLDDQGRRTASVQSASINPSWQEELSFPVSVQQWILSNLRIQLWNHDLFLTDDFLGQVTIPLKEVPVQEWDHQGNVPASEPKWYTLESRCRTKNASGRLLLGIRLFMTKRASSRASKVGGIEALKRVAEKRMDISSRAAKVGYHLQCRKQSLPGLVHHVQTSENHHHHHHHHHHPLHPGVMPPPIPPGGFKRGMSASTSNLDTSVRASIRSMEMEVENDRRRSDGNGRGSGVGGGGAGAGDAGVLVHSAYRQEGLIGMADYGDDEGVDGSGSGHLEEGRPMMGRMSSRHRRRSTRDKNRATRAASESSTGLNVVGATEVMHTDPLTRQLQLMLLAVETKAKVSTPEEGGSSSVDRDWVRAKLNEMLTMVGRVDMDLDELDTHTYYCKDRKENVYGPFPAKQLVRAHNAGYINDRKVLVKEARMRGEFRPMGARSLMHGPSSDEDFKALTVWPQADAHHPLADKILSPDNVSKDLRQWGFDIFGLDTQELGMLAATVLADTGLPRVFGINMKTFAHFMSAVGFFMGRKPRVTYHNLYHAVDVMHATYLTLEGMGASGLLTETEELALLLSALCHDLDHPGLTNSFQTATESPLANMYNDQAPLEHHHIAITFQILRREGCDILGHLDKPHRTRIRQVMIQGILATEMAEHATHIKKIDQLTLDYPRLEDRIATWDSGNIGRGSERRGPYSSSPPLYMENSSVPAVHSGPAQSGNAATTAGNHAVPASVNPGPNGSVRRGEGRQGSRTLQVPGAAADELRFTDSDRLAVASALLHGADLSSPGRPWGTCKVWVSRLLEEFKFQAEQERQRGLRVTVLEGSPSSSQPGFIDVLLVPFFTALLPFAPGLSDEYLPNLRTNRDKWQVIAQQESASMPSDGFHPVEGTSSSSANGSIASIGPSARHSFAAAAAGGAAGGIDPETRRPWSITFGEDRRYSGGTIGIAGLLGTSTNVLSGRSSSEGSVAERRWSGRFSGFGVGVPTDSHAPGAGAATGQSGGGVGILMGRQAGSVGSGDGERRGNVVVGEDIDKAKVASDAIKVGEDRKLQEQELEMEALPE